MGEDALGEEGAAVPRVSVVMSVYNGGRLVADAIDSILTQSLSDFEFIIVNDGSTDGTLAVLESYAAKDARIRILDQANTGLTKALVRGVAAARAPLIARMDADDLSNPERLERQAALLDSRPDLVAVSCGIENVAHDLRPLGLAVRRFDEVSLPLLLAFSNIIAGHGNMMFRKSAYDQAGGYDPEFRFSQDYDLWCRMVALGPIGEATGVLYRFRAGHDSISARSSDEQRRLAVLVAARQYQRVTGITPEQSVVSDAMDRWVPSAYARHSAARQFVVDRHIRDAVNRHYKRCPDQSDSRRRVHDHLADQLIQARRSVPGLAFSTRAALVGLAANWSPEMILDVLRQKLGPKRMS